MPDIHGTLLQPGTAEITVLIDENDSTVTMSLTDIEQLCNRSDPTTLSVDRTKKQSIREYCIENSPEYDRSRVIFLEV